MTFYIGQGDFIQHSEVNNGHLLQQCHKPVATTPDCSWTEHTVMLASFLDILSQFALNTFDEPAHSKDPACITCIQHTSNGVGMLNSYCKALPQRVNCVSWFWVCATCGHIFMVYWVVV